MAVAYITKYALTRSVFKADGEVDGNMFTLPRSDKSYCPQYFHGKDWHLTENEACAGQKRCASRS